MRFKSLLKASAAALGLATSGAALAADMPLKAPPLAPVAAPAWTGFYIGVNLGAAANHWKFADPDDFGNLLGPVNLAGTTFWDDRNTSVTGGAQAGYNLQFGEFVAGLEADVNVIDGTANAVFFSAPGDLVTGSTKLHWMSTVRGRLGFLPIPNALLFVTAGWAWARFSDAWGDVINPSSGGYVTSDHVRNAPVFGGGIEYMFAPHWTARVEGLYANFGTVTETIINFDSANYRTPFTHSVSIIRGALNFKW